MHNSEDNALKKLSLCITIHLKVTHYFENSNALLSQITR